MKKGCEEGGVSL